MTERFVLAGHSISGIQDQLVGRPVVAQVAREALRIGDKYPPLCRYHNPEVGKEYYWNVDLKQCQPK